MFYEIKEYIVNEQPAAIIQQPGTTETLEAAFENWISNNPKGGLFEYDNQKVMVTPKNILCI